MKKYGLVQRGLTLLLAIVMVVQLLPLGVLAATGDILVGDTGIVNESLGDGGTINWPVKIYDYLNDGMLFEPATSSLANGGIKKDSVLDGWYGLYGGGVNMPETLQGTDYTGNSAYAGSSDSNASINTVGPFLKYTKVAAQHFVSPQYLRLEKLAGATDDRICLVNFVRNSAARLKAGSYQQCLLYDDVRYMTLVYKTQGTVDDSTTQIWLESYPQATINSNGFVTKGGTWGRVQIDIGIPASSGWKALVIDLATVDPQMMNRDTGAATTWDQWKTCTAVYLKLSGLGTGDALDISHFSVFGSREEAELYGERCVAFNNDPGECLLQSRTITWTTGGEGEETTVVLPNAADPGFTLATDYNTLQNAPQDWDSCSPTVPAVSGSSRNYFTRPGLDLTRQGGRAYATNSYKRWATATSYRLFHDAQVLSFTSTPLSLTPVNDGDRDHVLINNSGSSQFVLETLCEDSAYGLSQGRLNYMVMVYRTKGFTGGEQYGLWAAGCTGSGADFNAAAPDTTKNFKCVSYVSGVDWQTSSYVYKQSFQISEDLWVADVIPMDTTVGAVDSDWNTLVYLKQLGMYLPALNGGKSLDLAYIAYFTDANSANEFKNRATAYMNSGKTTTTTNAPVQTHTLTFGANRTWNAGNNGGFGMYHGNQGGSWVSGGYGGASTNVSNGYYSYRIGYGVASDYTTAANQNRMPFGNTADRYSQYTLNTTTKRLDLAAGGKTNQIFYVGSATQDGDSEPGFNTGVLPLDGYDLLTTLTVGGLTAGLLEGKLKDGRPVYRQETVEYIAEMLYNALTIPQFDMGGRYNYNYVSGKESPQFATDLNGDGDTLDMIDIDGDQHAETNEAAMDLARALRHDLGIRFTLGTDRGTTPTYGDYAVTAGKDLIGTYQECRGSIDTCMDAAYFLLNNIFVSGSYNQEQNDFRYLTLSHAQLEEKDESGNNKTAYVFDAGFATKVEGYKEGDKVSFLDADKYRDQCAVDYNYFGKTDAEGKVIGDGTISLMDDQVGAKGLWYYSGDATTTRFPFLPVVDAEGPYAEPVEPYSFRDDGIASVTPDGNTYAGRNYNYVMASNGEFVYYEEDDLFFQFEGDDDVYLFLNDQLVLDIGGAHSITAVEFNVNDYVYWARSIKEDQAAYNALSADERARVDALALTEGQICDFDFYYMERHGTGANCRIVTNMHVTDPSLGVEKKATQFGQNVEFGGVVDASAAIGYEFALTNTGNTKLYNLTFTDDVIGVTLDPQKGLVVKTGMNGSHVRDRDGGMLDATDLSATVTGVDGNGVASTVDVSFRSNEELINFLKTLQAEGTQSGFDDSELTHAGSGLWVDATVSIKGIYYVMTLGQVEQGGMENIVYITATTKTDPADNGNQTLRSDAKHRIYTSGAPIYYQWAGHGMFLPEQKLLTDSTHEAGIDSSQLHKYKDFFTAADHDTGRIWTGLCDKHGNGMGDRNDTGTSQRYNTIEAYSDPETSAWGYLVEYDEAGTYSFYVLMYLNEQNGGYGSGTPVANMEEGTYAIIRLTVYVADVEDSTFVLDYGLRTESLDVGGELFKNDELFGSSGTMTAKLMGVSRTEPWYQYVKDVTTSDYNRISFAPMSENDMKNIPFADGHYSMNLAIGPGGKEITYNAGTGQYSLTDVGTMRINVDVPSDWDDVRLYYWYDNGANNGWPGTAMSKVDQGGSKYYLDIPADVGYVIVNNGNDDQKTDDLEVTPGMESSITVSARPEGDTYYPAVVRNVVKYADAHVKAPADWNKVYLYCWRDNGQQIVDWPGVEMEKGSDGLYSGLIPSETSYVIVNNGQNNMKQSNDIDVLAGKEVWISLDSESYVTRDDGVALYTATCAYTQNSYPVHVRVPDNWEAAYLHYWLTGTDQQLTQWPGVAMARSNDGWYTVDVPAGVSYMVVSCGTKADGTVPYQTVNITVNAGMEAWIAVADERSYSNDTGVGFHEAKVVYGSEGQQAGFSFTPDRIMKEESSLWLALTVHTTGVNPSTLASGQIDVNNEVQMFKKVTVLPANVVYYEDDFKDLQYTYGTGAFTHHGEGSGKLTQQVDQSQPYGQDQSYQAGSNVEMSGDSLAQLLVESKTDVSGVSFTFTGTGFELIGKTDARDCATIIVKVEKLVGDSSELIQYTPLIPEFDNGNDGGNEAITQVPVVRVKDLDHGTYRVSITGSLAYDFDSWDGTSLDTLKVVPTQMYVDGIRIFQPLGPTHDAYAATEKDAQFLELRDQVVDGLVAVAGVDKGDLTLSSGTMTWTENLLGDDFDDTSDVFVGNRVDSTGDYLIQGPNNEVYMEGAASNSAVVFYVSETEAASHELQLAVRGLDYERFFGVGNSPLSAQLQYGVRLNDGRYAWRVLADIHSGTEQYWSIPYTQCPKDDQGRYQVVIRAAAPHEGDLPMVSWSTLKLVGLELQKVDGVGESTLMYYKDGLIVSPDYWLVVGDQEHKIEGGELDISFETDTEVFIRQEFEGITTDYRAHVALGTTSATLPANGTGSMTVPGGKELTFKLVQSVQSELKLSYCAHEWGEHQVIVPVSCTTDGSARVVCTLCGEGRVITVPTTGHTMDPTGSYCTSCGYGCGHVWEDGECIQCGEICGHSWKDGACTVCGMPCEHTFQDSTCTKCGMGCTHSWTDGQCDHCGTACGHSWDIEKCTVCGEDRGLYLFGWIDGRNYACEEDSASLGIYGLTNRTITTRFSQTSYVAVKTGDNGDWFMTNGYPGDGVTSAKLYNTKPGNMDYNKLQIPGGVEVTLTLKQNSDGSLTLSYTVDLSTCTHASHKTSGECTLCGAMTSHSYQSGKCTVCGVAHPDTVLSYCLIGWINGADYGNGGDWQNPGQYKFVGGKLVASFNQDSYVGIKTSDNAKWYWSQNYISGSSGKFYADRGYGEKMFVPGNKQLVFTLVENSDGSLSLSYAAAQPAMDLYSLRSQMVSTLLVGAANEIVTAPVQPEPEIRTELTLDHPSLSFEDEVRYNVYFTATGLEDVTEMGLVTFGSRLEDGTVAEAVDVFAGYVSDGTGYMVRTEGIPAAKLGDALYFKVYARKADGTYVYSDVGGYSAKTYAGTVLGGNYSAQMKALVVAMLDYGAEAQKYFGHNTDKLVNASLTAEQRALVSGYDSTMMDAVVKADPAKTGDLLRVNSNFLQLYPSVSFDGAFAINFYCVPAIPVDGTMTMYWWDMETMATAEKLTVENAVGSMEMTTAGGIWWGQVPGIAAKEMDDTYYMACVFQSEGQTVTTGVIAYSLGKYCADKAGVDGDAQQSFAQATAVYGYYAKSYFASIA